MDYQPTAIIIPRDAVSFHGAYSIPQEILAMADRIELDDDTFQVVTYSATIIYNGNTCKFDGTGARIAEDFREMIANLACGKILYLENIFARSSAGEEIVVPWCIFRVV